MLEVFPITLLSLEVSALATLISLLIGLPFGTWLALGNFRGRSFVLSIINTGMALPPGSWLGLTPTVTTDGAVPLEDETVSQFAESAVAGATVQFNVPEAWRALMEIALAAGRNDEAGVCRSNFEKASF